MIDYHESCVKMSAKGQYPMKNHKNIGFLCNTSPDPLKNHKATKPTFNVGSSSACLRAAEDTLLVLFGSSLLLSTKKNVVKVGLPLTKVSRSAHVISNQ